MPEGDTVHLTARRLHAALADQVITTFDLRVPQLALADARGATMTEVVAVGKHILMRLSDERTLRSHLRMDGSWRIGSAADRPRGRAFEIRALVGNSTSLGAAVRVHDLALVPTRDEGRLIGHLGPDLLADHPDIAEAVRRFREQPDRPIGDALLDQRLVAGLGNVYKVELLFLHRLNPWLQVRDVTDLSAVLDDGARLLRANLTSFDRSTTGIRRPGQQYFVYGRAGRPCRRCGTPIKLAEQGTPGQERPLFYCPRCQAGP